LLHVLAAEPLGREVRYRMPGGQVALIFDDPSVYIESGNPYAPVETREDWCRLIERALRTDPNERWPTARSMADEMRTLVQREDIRGEVEIRLPWGDHPSLILDTKGQPTAGWVIESRHDRPQAFPTEDVWLIHWPFQGGGHLAYPAKQAATAESAASTKGTRRFTWSFTNLISAASAYVCPFDDATERSSATLPVSQ